MKESYEQIMAQRAEIMLGSVGIDYAQYTTGVLAFDYEQLLIDTGYDIETAYAVQSRTGVGNIAHLNQWRITNSCPT